MRNVMWMSAAALMLGGCAANRGADGSFAADANAGMARGAVARAAAPCVGCELAELVGHMSGSFASTAQSERDKEFFDIRLHMTAIWPQYTTPELKWLYVEQAMATQHEVAMRMWTTKSAVSRLESGRYARPTLDTVEKYALAVGARVEIRVRPG